MNWRPRALLVVPTAELAQRLFAWLTGADYDVVLVTTFTAAKALLRSGPHVVVSEVRLFEYNGLHLATRAQSIGIPSIVIGHRDPVLERDAQQMGVAYLTPDVLREALLLLASQLTAGAQEQARVLPMEIRDPVPSGNLAFITSAELTPAKTMRISRRFN